MNSDPGICVTTKLADVAGGNPIAVNVSVNNPAPLIRRFVNVATPLTAFTVVDPTRLPLPLAIVASTYAVDPVTTALLASRISTTGCVVKFRPLTAPPGCVVITTC